MNFLVFLTLNSNKFKRTIQMNDAFFKQSFKGINGKTNKSLPKLHGVSRNLIYYTTLVDKSNVVVSKIVWIQKEFNRKGDYCIKG